MTKGERLKAIEALSGRAVKLIDSFQARALSNVWWAFASMREAPSPVLLESLMQQSLANTDDFAPQTIANTLWSMARLRIPPNPDLMLALSTRAIFIAHEFQPQVLTVFVWVCLRSCVRAHARASVPIRGTRRRRGHAAAEFFHAAAHLLVADRH